MEWPDEFLNQPLIKWTLIILIIIIVGVFLTFFVQYNIDRANGKHTKFLWFESNIPLQESQINTNEKVKNPDTTISKPKEEVSQMNKLPTYNMIKQKEEQRPPKPVTINNSKNVNMGENYGSIGDTYTGTEQRHFTAKQAKDLINEIKEYKIKYSDKINNSHITIGYPGDKESKTVAIEAEKILHKSGFDNIQVMILMTYGVTGKLFGVSNAPDNSILIEIFPADNVQ